MFTLKYKNINEKRNLPNDNYTIQNLLDELELSAQTIVSKQNGELVIEETLIENGDEIQLIQIIFLNLSFREHTIFYLLTSFVN